MAKEKKMTRRQPKHYGFYEFIGYIAAPQISPLYFFALLSVGNLLSLQFFSEIIFSVVIPLSTLIFYARAIGADLFIKDRKVRAPLFYLGIISFFIGYLFLRFSGAPFIVTALMLSYAINTVAALILNFTLNKVSVHAWGISGPAVAVLYQYGPVAFVITIIAALFVGFTRIKMEHHTINEVVLALFTSVAITMLVIYAFPIGLMR